ncbi:glycoside hydrolase family 55 protein, partial [Oidiodendron maius Zn]
MPTGSRFKKRDDPYYWFEDLASSFPGNYPFGNDSSYFVFRNVIDYGAVGDGLTDDTAAINAAIADGNRCGNDCGSSSTKGAIVYFPPGASYLVSTPIIAYYNTQLVGNGNGHPSIIAAPKFVGLGVITSDVYLGGTAEWYINTNNFLRQIRYFVIDLTQCTTSGVIGIHWQVAQATSLQNIAILMTDKSTSTQVGIYSENGSGGFMSDIITAGGNIGLQCGNQQFTTRNMIFLNANYAIYMLWDWGWTWKSLDIVDCTWGIWFESTDVGGSIYVLDSTFTNVLAAIVMDNTIGSTTQEQVLITIDNMVLSGVTYAIIDSNPSNIILEGGSLTIVSWVLGTVYDPGNPDGSWFTGQPFDSPHLINGSLYSTLATTGQAGYFERTKPAYLNTTRDYWLSAISIGFVLYLLGLGDGSTDDTAGLSYMFYYGAKFGYGIFVPTGSYIIATPPMIIPINSVITGACWSQFVGSGDSFSDMANSTVMVKVANDGDIGTMEIQDILFTVKGGTQGAVLVEWNANQAYQGAVGMWDCHFRVGGAVGTNLQAGDCPVNSSNVDCIAASLLFHVTSGGSGYFENVWAWTADHDMDSGVNQTQINVFSGRGVLIESNGPCWFYGTASEHSVLYQYNIAGAKDIYMGTIQTESPYYPPFVIAPDPFTPSLGQFPNDPLFLDCDAAFPCLAAWALTITESQGIQITGAGLYSWMQNYDQACVDTQYCQLRLISIENNENIYLYNIFTIGSAWMVASFDGV